MYDIEPCSLLTLRFRAACFLVSIWSLAFFCHRNPLLHFIVSLILPFIFGSYAVFLIVNSYRTSRTPQIPHIERDTNLPFLSIIVPARDEASVLPRLCESISKVDYPSNLLQVIVVNDASQDETQNTLAKLSKQYSWLVSVHLKTPTGSKTGAMNAGYEHVDSKAEIVGYLDADAVLSTEVFRGVVNTLRDGRVAAVQAPKCVNPAFCDSLLGKMQFWEMLLDAAYQQSRCTGDGVPDLHGDGEFIRRHILDALGGSRAWNADSLTDDLDMTVRLSLLGYRIKYLPNWFAILEEPVYTWMQFVDQRRRWVMGGYQRFHDYFTQIISPPYHTIDSLPDLSKLKLSSSSSLKDSSIPSSLDSKNNNSSKQQSQQNKNKIAGVSSVAYVSPLRFWMIKFDLLMCLWSQYFYPTFWLADWVFAFLYGNNFVGWYLEKVYIVVVSTLVAPLYWRSGTIATWNYQLAWMLLTPVIGSLLMLVVAFVSFDTIIHPRSLSYTKSYRSSDREKRTESSARSGKIQWQYSVPIIMGMAWIYYLFAGQIPLKVTIGVAVGIAMGLFAFSRI